MGINKFPACVADHKKNPENQQKLVIHAEFSVIIKK